MHRDPPSHPAASSRARKWRILPLLSVIAVSVASSVALSCDSARRPDNRPIGTPPPPESRPTDGLLEDPRLQRLVDLQVARDGGGLAAALGDEDARVRARAAFALASVQDGAAGSDLAELLDDVDAGVRRDVAFALGQLGDAAFGPRLARQLEQETDPAVRARLFEALGKVGDARALEAFMAVEYLPEEAPGRALALARFGIRGVQLPTAITWLLESLTAESPELRESAAYYFYRVRDAGAWVSDAERVRAALDGYDPDEPAAMNLLRGLEQLGVPADTPRLRQWLLASPDWRIRASAAQALAGRVADHLARGDLLEALDDPSTHVAMAAGNSLIRSSALSPQEITSIRTWVADHPREWRRAGPLLAAIGRQGGGPFLVEWLRAWGPDEVLPRTRGLAALGFVPGEEAMQLLLEGARSPHARIAGTAMGALARRWRVERQDSSKHARYYQVFSEGLRGKDLASVVIAAPALADSAFRDYGAVTLLQEVYRELSVPEDVEAKTAILRALGRTGDESVADLLREESSSPSQAIRDAAESALGSLTGTTFLSGQGAPSESGRTVDWQALRSLGAQPRLILETEKGRIVLVLDAEEAPLTVQTIAGFAAAGQFDDVPFHRVVPNFVAQGGDFTRNDGFGGPGFLIRSEFTQVPYMRGVAGMASSGKDTEGSQYFITHSPQPHLDGAYTAFGWVVEGMDVLDRIYEEDRVVTARVESGGD
ncbi:MAG: peptidylprolyl isomerase [Dehalococcoidia bacterium]